MKNQNILSFSRSGREPAKLRSLALCVALLGGIPFSLLGQGIDERLHLSARLHPQYDYLNSDLSGTTIEDPETAERDFLRRLFAGVKWDFSDTLTFNYLTDYSDRVIKNQAVRLEWKPSEKRRFHFGYQKVPFGFEDTTSSSKIKAVERSASTRFWNEVVGIGSYRSGVFFYDTLGNGVSTVYAVTHNVKSDSDWPDIFSGEVGTYVRVQKKETLDSGVKARYGVDLAAQFGEDDATIVAASLNGDFDIEGYVLALEATAGSIGREEGGNFDAFGWHGQLSRKFAERFEWVARIAQVDTDGYQLKLSSAIRKAPYSGFKYRKVDSLYLGLNYFIAGNDAKISAGFELAEGRDALSGPADLDTVSEVISGFRVRGHFQF